MDEKGKENARVKKGMQWEWRSGEGMERERTGKVGEGRGRKWQTGLG